MEYSLSILLFAFSTAITPGPNNLMVMSSGLNYGFKRSIPHISGICFGLVVIILFIGAGLGALFEAYPIIHLSIKITGIIYLLYLAYVIATANSPKIKNKESKPFTFIQAAAFQWVNPKVWVVFIGAIATFTNPDVNLAPQIIFIAFSLLIAGLVSLNIWLWFGTSMAHIIQKARHRFYFNVSMAILLVISVVPMALSEIG